MWLTEKNTMAKTGKEHDKTAVRLTQILIKLNNGEKLDPHQLTDEFQVSLRTIQRDLLERFAFLPLNKDNHGLYQLEPYYLGKLNSHDIERFACLTGVKALFPVLKDDFLRELFDARIHHAYLVKEPNYEDLSQKSQSFKQLEQAIINQYWLQFDYKNKSYRVQPYKLVNYKAIWYLAAVANDQLKAFSFSKINNLITEEQHFIPNPDIHQHIQQEDDIWFTETKYQVLLKIQPSVAYYFQRRALLPHQQIEQTLEDGSLIISSRIGRDHQILPLIQYWLPNIEIISPIELKQSLLQILQDYLNQHGEKS